MQILPKMFRTFYPFQSGRGSLANSGLLKRMDGNPQGDIVSECSGFRLVVPQDDYVGRAIKYFGELDRKITWVVQRVLRPGDTAIDIGANLGLVSFSMLRRVGPSGKVHAFEPQSRMADYIDRSIALNKVDNLLLHRSGLGDTPGRLRLAIPDNNAGAASLCSQTGTRFEAVTVTTLDAFQQQAALTDVRLLKIDVEGFEPQVFSGGRNFFLALRPDVVIFEENRVGADGIPASVQIIRSLGYDVFALPRTWLSVKLCPYDPKLTAHDFVAIHRDAPPETRRALGL